MAEKEIGKVSSYFSNVDVAAIKLSKGLKIGEKVHIKGYTTDFEVDVESIQIEAIKNAQALDISEDPWKAMLGGYWEILGYLSRIVPVNLLSVSEDLHEITIRKYVPSLFITETLEVLSIGKGISNNWLDNEPIYYTKQQSRDYLESIMKLKENVENWRKEQQ